MRDVDESDLGELGMTKVQIKRFIRMRDSGSVDVHVHAPNIQKEFPVGVPFIYSIQGLFSCDETMTDLKSQQGTVHTVFVSEKSG